MTQQRHELNTPPPPNSLAARSCHHHHLGTSANQATTSCASRTDLTHLQLHPAQAGSDTQGATQPSSRPADANATTAAAPMSAPPQGFQPPGQDGGNMLGYANSNSGGGYDGRGPEEDVDAMVSHIIQVLDAAAADSLPRTVVHLSTTTHHPPLTTRHSSHLPLPHHSCSTRSRTRATGSSCSSSKTPYSTLCATGARPSWIFRPCRPTSEWWCTG